VLVDEAHNWTNRANGADAARLAFLHRASHALLLTATPLQLEAEDLPNLLGQFTDLGASLHKKPPSRLIDDLSVVSARLANASKAATRFRSAWAALGDTAVSVVGSTADADDDRLQSAIDELNDANRALEKALRPWLIRHRRSRARRRVLVGAELTVENLGPKAPEIAERTMLHDALGIENHHAQLAQLALMRLVGLALAQRGDSRRTTLAASMTGCYSTINVSKEGHHLLNVAPEARAYRDLIQPHIDVENRLIDGKAIKVQGLHPKLQSTLDVIEELWQEGEKVLVYCWRVHTAKIVAAAIRRQLGTRATGPAWTLLQRRIARPPLLAATQDRIVHSLCLAGRVDKPYDELVDETRERAVSALSTHGMPPKLRPSDLRKLHDLHQVIVAEAALSSSDGVARKLLAAFIERGPVVPTSQPRLTRAPQGIVSALLDEPALLTGAVRPRDALDANRRLATSVDRFTERFSSDAATALDWRSRLVELLTLAIRSTQTLARLPGLRPEDHPDALQLADAVARAMRSRGHVSTAASMLDRLAELVDGYTAIEDERNLREALQEFRTSQDRLPVAEVTGTTKRVDRSHIFERFNSPLFPDILVCTQIGGEGIDLHRFCRVVIHYDLSFNPAKLEQRTGRCDRIGSRSERYPADLIVGVPLLAGSYDERIYATLLERDREQEALIGSGVGGEQGIAAIEEDREDQPDEATASQSGTRPLPPALVDLLRCSYHVWSDHG